MTSKIVDVLNCYELQNPLIFYGIFQTFDVFVIT